MMENQISVQAKNKLQPLEGGESLAMILKEPSIQVATFETVKKPLRYAMVLVGLRAENYPVPIQTDVIIKFLKENYSDYTPAEIAFAFEKAMARKLPLQDVKCFENFSCEYIGRILYAYEQYQGDTAQLEKYGQDEDFWRKSVQDAFTNFLKGEVVYSGNPKRQYQQLVFDRLTLSQKANAWRGMRYFQAHIKLHDFFMRARDKGITEIYREYKSAMDLQQLTNNVIKEGL